MSSDRTTLIWLPLSEQCPAGWPPAGKFAFRQIQRHFVSHVHRDRQTSVVLLFAGSVLVMNLLPFAFVLGRQVPFLVPLLTVNAASSVLGILLGGGLFHDRSRVVSN
jgi:hypothetical protein